MRIAKTMKLRMKVKSRQMIVMDEFHLLADAGGSLGAVFVSNMMLMRKTSVPHRPMIATQAMMKFNSGKRVRFLGSMRWEDTGEAVKPAPKKFVPAHVMRRARE